MSRPSPIRDAERQTYQDVWQVEHYTKDSPGERYAPVFLEMAGNPIGPASVLDAGCGAARGARAIAMLRPAWSFALCDLTPAGLEGVDMPWPFVETALWRDLAPVAMLARAWADGQPHAELCRLDGEKFDYVYCCDVLEHIPEAFTMLVIQRLLDVSRKGVFLSICLMPDVMGAWVGKPLHQTVQPFTVWRDRLAELTHVRECRDLLHTGLYFLEPRR